MEDDAWDEISLTLDQFGLDGPTNWLSNRDFIVQSIKRAPDATLRDLADHNWIANIPRDEEATAELVVEPVAADRPDKLHIFISHLSAERQFAAELQAQLEKFGCKCFVAHNDIEPTEEWERAILTWLSRCDLLVALLHEGFHDSHWTDQEIGFVMGRGKPVFALNFGNPPYGFIGRFQAFPAFGKTPEKLASNIFDALKKHPQTRAIAARQVVALFEASSSFKAANARMAMVEELELWEPSFSERLSNAVETNSQIKGAFGVTKRVKAVIEKRGKS